MQDRFKDVALRFSLTPLAKSTGLLKTLQITPWFQVGRSQATITTNPTFKPGLENNAGGLFVGNTDSRLTFGLEYGRASDARRCRRRRRSSPHVELYDGFVQVRPSLFSDPKGVPWGVVLRYDHFQGTTANDVNRTLLLGGVFLDVAKASSFGISYQHEETHNLTVPTTAATAARDSDSVELADDLLVPPTGCDRHPDSRSTGPVTPSLRVRSLFLPLESASLGFTVN